MDPEEFYIPLREARTELASARAAGLEAADTEFVSAVEGQVQSYLAMDTEGTDPPPGPLETLVDHLGTVRGRADEPAAGHLRRAEDHLSTVVATLEERLPERRQQATDSRR